MFKPRLNQLKGFYNFGGLALKFGGPQKNIKYQKVAFCYQIKSLDVFLLREVQLPEDFNRSSSLQVLVFSFCLFTVN